MQDMSARPGAGTPGAAPAAAASKRLHVACRVRPLSDSEKRHASVPTVAANTERGEVIVTNAASGRQVRSSFQFDSVLSSYCSQHDVFNATVKPSIRDICDGFEAVAFAYGPTGAGKTHSVEGSPEGKEAGRGLVVRATEAIMQELASGSFSSATVSISCVEAYNEELSDLLSQKRSLTLKETDQGVTCPGLTEVKVSSGNDVQEMLRTLQQSRAISDMKVPGRSNRSHRIFTIKVSCRQRVPGGEYENTGKLHLVDLAGSESLKKDAGHSPREQSEAERERRSINHSLLTLKRVLASCHDESVRMPYKDSVLTRFLQDALSGACHIVLLVAVSPSQATVEEAMGTLTYAEQAMGKAAMPILSPRLAGTSPIHPMAATGGSGSAKATTPREAATPISTPGYSDVDRSQLESMRRELKEAQTIAETKKAEAEACKHQLRELQAKFAAATGQLEASRQAEAEQKIIASRTAELADHRSADAKALGSALAEANSRNAHMAEVLAKNCHNAASCRGEVEDLSQASAQRYEALVEMSKDLAGRLLQATEDSQRGDDSSFEAMVQLASQLQQLLHEVAAIVRDQSLQVSESLSFAVVKACEAAAAELTQATGRLEAVEASAQKSSSHAAEMLSHIGKAVASQTSFLREHADTVRKVLRGRGDVLSAGVQAVARDIGIAEMNAASAEAAFAERLQNSIGRPLLGLGEVVHAASVACDAHNASLERATNFCAAEATAAAARRHGMRDDLHCLAEAHATSVEGAAPLQQVLDALGKVMAKESKCTSSLLPMVTDELMQDKQQLTDSSSSGEAALTSCSKSAEENFAGAWTETEKLVAVLEEALGGDQNVTARMDLHGDPQKMTAVATLSRKLSIVLSALLCARGSIEAEVAALRQQRRDEEEIVALLTQQREALTTDCAQAEHALALAKKQLEVCHQSMTDLEEAQIAKQEATVKVVMSGLETLLRSEFTAAQKQLGSSKDDVKSKLTAVAEQCQHTAAAVQKARSRADRTAGEVEQQANAWGAGAASACDGITAAQESAELAAKELESAANDCMSKVSSAVKHVRAAEHNSKRQWTTTADASATAVATWRQKTMKVAAALGDTAAQTKETADALAALQEEASGHHRVAARHAATRAGEDDRQSAAFATLLGRHDEHETVDVAAEAERRQSLAALAEGAEAVGTEVVRCAPLVACLGEAADALAAETLSEGRSHRKAMIVAKTAIESLPSQCEALLTKGSDGAPLEDLQQMCTLGTEMAHSAVAGLTEVSDSAGAAAVTISGLVQAQRCALAAFMNNESEERWVELEASQDKKLKAMEGAVQNAAETGMAAVAKTCKQAEEARQHAAASRNQAQTELNSLLTQQASALAEQHALWKNGVGSRLESWLSVASQAPSKAMPSPPGSNGGGALPPWMMTQAEAARLGA